MRLSSLLALVLVPVVSAATLGWWIATLVMGALVRSSEGRPAQAKGPPAACASLLFGYWLVASAIAVAVAVALLWAMLQVPAIVGLPDQQVIARTWRFLVWIACALTALAAVGSATGSAVAAMGAARRRWELQDLGPLPPNPVPQPPTTELPGTGGRSIVILCDGTSNRPDEMEDGQAAPTNIYKLFKILASDEVQTTWYEAGVGSDTSSTAAQVRRTKAALSFFGANAGSQVAATFSRIVKLVESTFGSGISETIVNGYTEIVRQYRPGDRIYIVGFSRGAYAARCIAGVVSRCGLLRAENIRYATEMVQLYRTRENQSVDADVRPDLLHPDPAIEFVGVFDTVASLGVPLWGWWFRVLPIWKNQALATDPVRACRHVYHALAMDERRSEFIPTLYTRPKAARANDQLQTLEQVWFRGAHCDVGGGYARSELSDITLGWMMDAMQRHGLRFRTDARSGLTPDPLGRLHDELERQPGWTLLGSWPRWHPVPGAPPDETGTTLHSSVLQRAAAVQARTGRPDMLRLAPGEHVVVTAEAQRTWDRTGVVIDQGGQYRLTYLGETWRDGDSVPCSPSGQEATGIFDLRRWWKGGRRLPAEPWMRLVATVAHPRRWPLQEKGFKDLVPLLFGHDPVELTSQLAPIGRDLGAPGKSVLLHNLAPGGLLCLFANDWWQTASNNSGGARLRIERIDEVQPGVLWTLLGDGTWQRTENVQPRGKAEPFPAPINPGD